MKINHTLKHSLLVSAALTPFFFSTPVFAASVPEAATSIANPSRVEDQFTTQTLAPDISQRVEVKDAILQKMPSNAADIKFTLTGLQIEGVGAYSEADLAPFYQDKIGETVSLADIYRISSAITNKYRNDGYILTQIIIPPQTIDGGIVHLKAVEGFVDKITVEGEGQESAQKLIRAYANNIHTQGALNVRDLEKFLLLINDLPGVDARSILSPSKTQAGASDLRIIIERDPYDALLSLDNYGSRYLGPVQVGAAGSLNSFFGQNERITTQIVVAPEIGTGYELAYGALGYMQPIWTHGTMLKLSASNTFTDPGYNLDEFNVSGRSQFMSIAVEHPFIRTRARNLYGHVSFDWRNVESKNDLEATRRDHLRVLRAGGRFEFLDTFLNAGINNLNLEISKGLNILGSSEEGDLRLSRTAGDPTFTKLNAGIQRIQRVTSGINVLMSVQGQWASSALLASEEFGIGGFNSGRGYDPSEIVGDDGIAGKLELQWNEPYKAPIFEDYQLYSFYDIGKVWNKDATTSAGKQDSIASAGFGLRADFANDIEAGAAVAFPLTRDVETQQDKDPRFYFSINRRF